MFKSWQISKWSNSSALIALVAGLCVALAGCDATSNGKVKQQSEAEQPAAAQAPEDEKEGEEKVEAEKTEEVRSQKQRLEEPDVSEEALNALVEGNTEFAFELYKKVADGEKNVFFSPFSISEALAMAYAGAAGDTAEGMAKALHVSADQALVHPAFNALDLHLMSLNEQAEKDESERPAPLELSIANSIWGQQGYGFKDDFLDTLALNYGAGLQVLDFVGQPDTARDTINEWVEDETKERIKDLLPQGAINADTRMVLTNAIYFKAGWFHQFQEEVTESGDFTRADDSTVKAELMAQRDHFEFADLGDFKAVELGYGQGEASMLVLLPEDIEAFQQDFGAETLQKVDEALERKYVELTLPRFEFTQTLLLSDILGDLGMAGAFSPAADFSNMSEENDLFIGDVVHKAFVAVDEEGTEAAAATALMMRTTSMPPEPVEFRADKPFVFLIRDAETKSVLFMGAVNDPSA